MAARLVTNLGPGNRGEFLADTVFPGVHTHLVEIYVMLLSKAAGFCCMSPNSLLSIATLHFLSLSLISAKQKQKAKAEKKNIKRNTSVKELYSFVGSCVGIRQRWQRLRLETRVEPAWGGSLSVPSGARLVLPNGSPEFCLFRLLSSPYAS